jgi:hypothetical protein
MIQPAQRVNGAKDELPNAALREVRRIRFFPVAHPCGQRIQLRELGPFYRPRNNDSSGVHEITQFGEERWRGVSPATASMPAHMEEYRARRCRPFRERSRRPWAWREWIGVVPDRASDTSGRRSDRLRRRRLRRRDRIVGIDIRRSA